MHCTDSRRDEELELRWKMGRLEEDVILNKTSVYFIVVVVVFFLSLMTLTSKTDFK